MGVVVIVGCEGTGKGPLTVCLGAFCRARLCILVLFVFDGDWVLRGRRDDLAEPLEALVEVAGARHVRGGVLRVLHDAERGEVVGDRAAEMPERHDVLLLLGGGLHQPLPAHRLLVLVGRQHDPDPVLLVSLARRAGHFETVAGLAGGFLGSSVQREVLGDVLRDLEAAARRKSQ